MEKSQPSATDTEAPPHPHVQPYVWHPGIRRTPWTAFLALLVMLLCSPAAATVLAFSNGQIADWVVQPSVLLSIISSIWNTALLYLLFKGISISWWRAALRGTTLEQLNRIWLCGSSARAAIFSIRHVKRIGIASLFGTFATLSVGPLLQRASHTILLNVAQEVNMQLYLPTKLPTGFAGVAWDSSLVPAPGNTLLNPNFLLAIQTWFVQAPIVTLNTPGFWCEGTCEATVQGAGISTSCSSSYTTVDLTQITTSGFTGFSTSFTRFENSNDTTLLQATSSYISTVDDTCKGTYVTEICDMRVSINTYPLVYENYTLMKNPNISVTVVEEYWTDDDLTNAPFESPVGLLSGLNWFADTYLVSNSSIVHGLDPSGNEMYIAIHLGPLSAIYLNLTDAFTAGELGCQSFEWDSPTEYIIRSLNLVALNAALIAGWDKNQNDLQAFSALQTQPMVVYVSDYGYLGVAMFIHAVAIVAVSITLYGFWQIGHDVSLSPLQTGRALGSSVLAGGEGGGSGENLKKLVKEVGMKEVKYGVVSLDRGDGIGIEKLGIAQPHMLVRHFRK